MYIILLFSVKSQHESALGIQIGKRVHQGCILSPCLFNLYAMAPHSSTFAWKIPWTEEPGGLQSMGLLESDTTEQLHFHFSLSCIGEGNGNPLQCSCLENPRDGEAWWAAVYGIAQSRTRLKRLSSSSNSNLKMKTLDPSAGELCWSSVASWYRRLNKKSKLKWFKPMTLLIK